MCPWVKNPRASGLQMPYSAYVMFVACVLGVSFDKARVFDLDIGTSQGHGQGQLKVVREQLMTEDTKDVEPSVDYYLAAILREFAFVFFGNFSAFSDSY